MSIEAVKQMVKMLEEIHVGNVTPMAEKVWSRAIAIGHQAIAEAKKQEPVGSLILGGVFQTSEGLEFEEWDVEWNNKAVDALQEKLVTSDEVVLNLYTSPPQRQPLTDEQPMYYLQDTRGYVGNCPLWWGLNGNGYTTDLRKAQKYTLAEAMSQHRCRNSDLPWLCSEIDATQRPTIDVQDMHKMRSVDDQRAALQADHGIKGEA